MSFRSDRLWPDVQRQYGTLRGWVRHLLGLAEWRLWRLRAFQSADPAAAQRLVFVCLGNINRSAFGVVVARALGEPAHSFGLSTTTGSPATPQAVLEAARRGYDLKSHCATDMKDYHYCEGDLLLVMEVRHAKALVRSGFPARAICLLGLWSQPRRVHLHDPHTLSSEYFETCFGLIEAAVHRLAAVRSSRAR